VIPLFLFFGGGKGGGGGEGRGEGERGGERRRGGERGGGEVCVSVGVRREGGGWECGCGYGCEERIGLEGWGWKDGGVGVRREGRVEGERGGEGREGGMEERGEN